jgi:SsrA-binding protein
MVGRKQSEAHVIARNRAATFHYELSDSYEAGIVLRGSEVKSLREGRVHLVDAFATVERGEVWLRNLHIASFLHARAFPHKERDARKLLLHAREIQQIERAILREGYTLVPLDLHFNHGRVKVALAVGRGKKTYDKRAAIAERTEEMEALQEVRARMRRSG